MIAAIDVGLKRIGVAISPDGRSALPQRAILRKNRNQAAAEVDTFLKEWGIETLAVGLPKGGSSEEEMARRIRHFVSLLRFSGRVLYVDESDTSTEAEARLKGVVRLKRDGRIDSVAAQLILERALATLREELR